MTGGRSGLNHRAGQPSCGSCRYMDVILSYEDDDQPDEEGVPTSICRRFPPIDGWPNVLSDDWCGEWEAA